MVHRNMKGLLKYSRKLIRLFGHTEPAGREGLVLTNGLRLTVVFVNRRYNAVECTGSAGDVVVTSGRDSEKPVLFHCICVLSLRVR